MGKLLQATRRMVNEAFGTNFGRVRNVEKAWEMAQEENAEHARRQTERKLASLALDEPRIAELKNGSGLPETKVGSPEFIAKMFEKAGEYMSDKEGGTSTEKWLPMMYDLPSLAEEMTVNQVSCYGDPTVDRLSVWLRSVALGVRIMMLGAFAPQPLMILRRA